MSISYDQVINIIDNKQWFDPDYIPMSNLYNQPWSQKDDNWLKNNYLNFTHKQLGEKLNRTKLSIKHRCNKLKLRSI